MKRIALIVVAVIVALFVSVVAQAQTWHTANQATLAWDPVAKIQPADNIMYQVYTKFGVATATPQAVGTEIAATQQTITFPNEGRYYLCVLALRYPEGESQSIPSERMACSDVAADTQAGVPFGVKFFVAPGVAGGLRFVQ